jgi:acetyl-CoA acyltransferase
MANEEDSMSDVYIVGVGMTSLGKQVERSVKQLSAAAIGLALADAAIDREKVEAAWFCNTRQGALEGQHGIRGQCALRAAGFQRIPIFNTDNACASSSSGLFLAYAAVRAGLFDVVLVVGAEKMYYPQKRKEMFEAFRGGWDRDLGEEQLRDLLAACDGAGAPPQAEQPAGERSVFMDIYAAQARLHMRQFGTTERQIATVAAKNHWHSQWNPLAQYRAPMSVEQVLGDKLIAWPLTRSMCAPISDGAAALVVASEKALSRLDASRAVRIRGIAVGSGTDRAAADYERHLTRQTADEAYALAGVDPADISVAELHDASAIAEILQSEHCRFCDYGEGGPLVESGATRFGGRLPINVSGGLISKGHPVGATGAIMLHELVTQLRGEAAARQVRGARLALAENGGGFYGVEEAVCVVTILEAPTPRRSSPGTGET